MDAEQTTERGVKTTPGEVDQERRAHIEEEEGPMFLKVRQVFSKDDLEDLGSRMAAAKAEQMQEAMPERDQVNL